MSLKTVFKVVKENIILILVYYVTGHLSMDFLATPPSNAASIWPPAGISLAAVLLYGNRILPAVLIGDLIIASEIFGFKDFITMTVSMVIGFQAFLSAWLGASLIRRFLGCKNPLIDNRSIILFLFLGGPVSQLLSAILAVYTELWLGIINYGDVNASIFTWWVGSSFGVVLFAPLVYILLAKPRLIWKNRKLTVALPLISLFIVGVWFMNFIKTDEQLRLKTIFNHYVETDHQKIINDALSLADTQDKIKYFIEAFSPVSETEFSMVSKAALRSLDDISALAWIPAAKADGEEKSIRIRQIEPQIVYQELLDINFANYHNWQEMIKQARETGKSRLINATYFNLASGQQRLAAFVTPVYDQADDGLSDSSPKKDLQGFLAMIFNDEILLNSAVDFAGQHYMSLNIVEYDAATSVEKNLDSTGYGFKQVFRINALGKTWEFVYQPTDEFIKKYTTYSFWWVFIAGFCVIGLVGFVLLSITAQTLQTQIQVNEKTNELNNKHRLLESILNNVQEGIVACDKQGRITMINRAAQAYYGFKVRNMVPSQWSAYYKLFEADGLTQLSLENNPLYKALNGEDTRASELVIKYIDSVGRALSVNSQPLRDENEQVIGAVASFQDITQHKHYLNELKMLSLAVQHSPSAVMMTDTQGSIEYINDKFVEINGYTIEDVKGQTPRILKSGKTPKEQFKHLWKALLSGQDWQGEMLNKKKNGQLYWSKQFISPVKNEQGNVTHFVSIMEDVTEMRKKAEIISYQASHDDLTGLLNRRECEKRLERVIKTARQNQTRHVFCFLDLDKFKIVNDTCGHIVGDDLLRRVSELLSKHLRQRDTLARLGGDEFCIIMEHCTLAQAKEVSAKICRELDNLDFSWQEHHFKIGVSIGLTEINNVSGNFSEVMEEADKACYQVKKQGRGQVAVYSKIIDKD